MGTQLITYPLTNPGRAIAPVGRSLACTYVAPKIGADDVRRTSSGARRAEARADILVPEAAPYDSQWSRLPPGHRRLLTRPPTSFPPQSLNSPLPLRPTFFTPH